jgi:hypothetical protein
MADIDGHIVNMLVAIQNAAPVVSAISRQGKCPRLRRACRPCAPMRPDTCAAHSYESIASPFGPLAPTGSQVAAPYTDL